MNKFEKPNPGMNLEVARVLAAAIVNPTFCNLLLTDPKTALEQGYEGESFLLSDQEKGFLLTNRADTLQDLAKQLLALQSAEKPLFG